MKLLIEDLKREGKLQFHSSFHVEDKKMREEFGVVGKILIDFDVNIFGEGAYVSGEYSAKAKTICGRCLSELELDLFGEFEIDYLYTRDYEDFLESQIDNHNYCEKEAVKEKIVDGEMDIMKIVRDDIILNYPTYSECSTGCDLIDQPVEEQVEEQEVDPRWQELLKITK